jgi:hypothetical protein
MFRKGLLLSTAFMVVGSLAFLAVQSEASAQPSPAATGRDRNEEFLATYGGGAFSVYASSAQSSHSGYHRTNRHWQHVAVPITGKGQTVHSIIVKEGRASASSAAFSAGIYSNTAGGLPGILISGGTGVATKKHPSRITIPISATTLASNTTYWIEELIPNCRNCSKKDYWKINKRSKLKAYVEDYRYTASSSSGGYNYSYSSTTPWSVQTAGPFFKVK